MKKGIALLLILLTAFSLFADAVSGAVTTTTSPQTASIKYTINPSEISYDAFTVGFSKIAVSDFTEVAASDLADATNAMSNPDGTFVGQLSGADATNKVYIFWQIANSEKNKTITISLSASSMQLESGSEYINVTLETAQVRNDKNDGSAIATTDYTTDGNSVSGNVLEFNSTSFTDGMCTGSQLITVVTENIAGKTAGSYSGDLTATITIEN